MDVIAFIVGLIIGVITVGLAIEIGMRRVNKTQPVTRPTHKWSIAEIANPRIIAENMGAMAKDGPGRPKLRHPAAPGFPSHHPSLALKKVMRKVSTGEEW